MGLHHVDGYVLLLQGENILPFLDGLSSNRVDGSCTTVFTDRAAKIIDACDILVLGANVAIVGYGDAKDRLIHHLLDHLLGQKIQIRDISSLNKIYIGDGEEVYPENATIHKGWFGTVCILGTSTAYEATWTEEDWREHRVKNVIPFAGHEVTSRHHPFACGLAPLVHSSKGCYIGQEVLTRMKSRGKFGHRLVVGENPVTGATTVGKTHSLSIERIQ